MASPSANDELLTRYLLGEVSDEERTLIEERFLADEEFFQELLAVEEELRCAYAAGGSLSPADRERFERQFLIFHDERRKVELARTFVRELSARSARPSATVLTPFRGLGTGRYALAAAAVVILAVLTWQIVDGVRLRSGRARLEAERASQEQAVAAESRDHRTRVEQLERELQDERRTRALLQEELARQREPSAAPGRPAPGPVLSLFLTPGRVRAGGETKTLTIPRQQADVRLLLAIEGQPALRGYRAEILNSNGDRVWSGDLAPGAQQVLILTVPANALAEDDYEISLTGTTPAGERIRAGDYYFTVLKR